MKQGSSNETSCARVGEKRGSDLRAAQMLLFAPGGPAVWVKLEDLRQTKTRAERWKGGKMEIW
jgi:hypothetical protein